MLDDVTVTDDSSRSSRSSLLNQDEPARVEVPQYTAGEAKGPLLRSSDRRLRRASQRLSYTGRLNRAVRSGSVVSRCIINSQSTQDGAADIALERIGDIKRVLEKQRRLLEEQEAQDLSELSEERCLADAEAEHVVDELIRTEANYLQDLEFTLTEFCRPLQQLLTEGQIHYQIFSNLEQLHELHLKLGRELRSAQQLQTSEKQEAVLAAFTLMLPYFKMYSQYCANYPNSSGALLSAHAVPAAGVLLEQREAAHTTALQALLFRPVQRICLYPLLFQNMLKQTHPNAPYHHACEKMLEGAMQLTAQLNENVRQHEARHYMSEVLTKEVQLQPASLEYLFQASMSLEHEAVVDMKCRSGTVLSKSRWRIRRPYKCTSSRTAC